ncbi:hypothetical protein L218DRAFT_991444 [Marasmius fiardii PR-910]|nr:hypothetical protein L218DRAFT_991444 [Marasmius fiardii PR-910]
MKLFSFALTMLGFLPLLAQAADPLTLIQFVDPTEAHILPALTTTLTEEYAEPVGAKGGETTYFIHVNGLGAATTTVDGATKTVPTGVSLTQTYVVSASGFRVQFPENSPGGSSIPIAAGCHFTAASAGECILAGIVNSTTLTSTRTGIPYVQVIPVSGTVTPTGNGGNNGAGPASGNGTGNGNGGSNGAMDVGPGKLVGVVFGGLVLGVLAAFS